MKGKSDNGVYPCDIDNNLRHKKIFIVMENDFHFWYGFDVEYIKV